MSKVNALFEILMKREISEGMFKGMLSLLRDNSELSWICKHFTVSEDELVTVLRRELFISGMTNEIAWTALCWIRMEVESGGNTGSLVSVLKAAILASGVYYTNVPADVREKLEQGKEVCDA